MRKLDDIDIKGIDDALGAYFATRTDPPQELRMQLRMQMIEAEDAEVAGSAVRWIWGIVFYDFVISFAVLFALWLLFGMGTVLYVGVGFFGFSLVAAVAVAAVNQHASLNLNIT